MEKVINAKIVYSYEKDKYSFKLETPLSVCWQITRKCNLKCKYCLSDSSPQEEMGLSTEDALKLIDMFGRSGVMRLDFTGGEPLLRTDLRTLLRRCKEWNINTIVTTNTLTLNPEKIKTLKDDASLVQVSIDGPREVHNEQRGADVFDKTMENIQKLMDAGCKIRLNSFIYRDNLSHVDYLLGLSEKMNVFSHLFILFTPQGRGEEHIEQLLTKEESEELKNKLIAYRDRTGRYIRLYDYDEYEHSCVLVTPLGDVISQALYQKDCIKVGNLFEQSLTEIFNNDAFEHFTHIAHYLQRRNG